MTPTEIRTTLFEVIAEVAPDADPSVLSDDDDLLEELDLDSMDHLNVVAGLTERLGVDIPERDYPRIRTVAGVIDYLSSATA